MKKKVAIAKKDYLSEVHHRPQRSRPQRPISVATKGELECDNEFTEEDMVENKTGVLAEELKNLMHRVDTLKDEIDYLTDALNPLLPEELVVNDNACVDKTMASSYPHIRTLIQCNDIIGSCHDKIRYLQQNVAT